MERATGTEVYGCGSPQSTDITLNIQTTTGGNFSISLNGKNTVQNLKKLVSKKLKVSQDRICLLHRERQLRDGTLEENGLLDGSRVILLPSVETGLLSQRPESSVMQALESLNDTQVNDFLSGKSPLNLTMRLGDHMMLIQLQLSTLNSSSANTSRTMRTAPPTKLSTPIRVTNADDVQQKSNTPINQEKETHSDSDSETTDPMSKSLLHTERYRIKKEDLESFFGKDLYDSIAEDDDKKELDDEKEETDERHEADEKNETMDTMASSRKTASGTAVLDNEQSPIKSLSNLVSSPLATSVSDNKQNTVVNAVKSTLLDMLQSKLNSVTSIPSSHTITLDSPEKACNTAFVINPESSSDDSDAFTDQSSFLAESTIDEYPMENLFNSAVDKGYFENEDESMMDREISNLATTSLGSNKAATTGPLPSFQSINEPLKTKRFQYLLHKTSKFKHPIGQNKQKAFMQSVVNKHKKRMQSRQDNDNSQPTTSRTEPYSPRKLLLQPSSSKLVDPQPSTSKQSVTAFNSIESPQLTSFPSIPDTKALMEASKNLTQTLKKLSKEVLTNKADPKSQDDVIHRKKGPGAVIETMKHHGRGIYSGTFSGTLNPALQDRYGRPKRDISTIIHILNDLLCATSPVTVSQKDSKHSCATSTTESKAKCAGCSQPSCSYGQCSGHLASACKHPACVCTNKTGDCKCKTQLVPYRCVACPNCSGKSESCKKCVMAKTFALENTKTKWKLEQLRLVMQQKKQRREARKMKMMPYTTSPPKILATSEQNAPIKEEIETIAFA